MSLPAPSFPDPVEDFGEFLIETKVRAVLPYADGPRLLVVEDEPVDRMHIRRLLRKTGIPTTVDEAESVTSAHEAIAAADFDCVLLDYGLGDGGGSDVMSAIRETCVEHAPGVVFVTGRTDKELAYHLKQSGAVDVIAKDGLTPEALRHAVEAALSRRTAVDHSRRALLRDPVTGLPGLQYFEQRLDNVVMSSVRDMKPAIVMMIEIANSAEIIDRLGADLAETFLTSIVSRLKAVVSGGDILARTGANRFSIIAQNRQSASMAGAISLRIMNWLRMPYRMLGDLEPDFRMGISICPHDGHGTVALMRATEAALGTTGPGTKGNIRFYHALLGRNMNRRLELLADLSYAIERDQLRMMYQPAIDNATGRMAFATADIRWLHPVHGPVFVDELLPLAEKAGIAGPIAEWALDQCCDAVAAWQDARRPPLQCSLAVGHEVLTGGHLSSLMRTRLRASGMEPATLILTLNADTLAHNSMLVAREIKLLADAGVQIAIDEFGDPEQSMPVIDALPVSWLRLSPLLLLDPEQADDAGADGSAGLRAAIAMAEASGVRTVATGLNTSAQIDHARACGIQYVQGDLISPPLPLVDLAVWSRTPFQAKKQTQRGEQPSAA
jgi:diguanylate cyclase (GGDEF)-like protein